MVGFVIPFRPKANSKNWEKDNLLLKRTLNSILNQTDNRFRTFVVYTDYPQLDKNYTEEKVQFIKFPYNYMSYSEMALNEYDCMHTDVWLERETDKARKIMFGCKFATEANCSYVMQVDSDDLVSRKIVSYVMEHTGEPGWYIDKGYLYIEQRRLLIKQPSNMHLMNGSTYIIRKDLIPNPVLESNEIHQFYFFAAHGYLRSRIKQLHNLDIKPLPFWGNVYVASGINQSNINELLLLTKLRTVIKTIIRFAFLTNSIKKEFGLYPIDE